MGHGQDGTLVILQMLLQPQHGLGVQVVSRLVQQQQVRLAKQQLGQRHAATLTTGEVGHRLIGRRAAQRFHGLLDLGIQFPRVCSVDLLLQSRHLFHQLIGVVGGHFFGDLFIALADLEDLTHALFDVLANGLFLVQRRLLHEDAHGCAGIQECLTVGGLIDARHDLQDGGLTCTIRSHYADLGAGVERHRDVIQNDFVAVRLAHVLHGVNELAHGELF